MLSLKILIALAPIALAAQNPGDTVTVHVSASRFRFGATGSIAGNVSQSTVERLNAVINGRKLELTGNLSGPDLLIPGDYRAQLLSESHESDDEIRQSYRILLPANRSRTFIVTGIQE